MTEKSVQARTDAGSPSKYKRQFGVIVICPDESKQKRVYKFLKSHGLECKVVVT